ncbi:MAG: hypothetical protein DRI80_15095, partial [Chloroflexota bacterium]
LIGLSRMLAKRRQIIRRVSSRAMMAKLQPLENPLAVLRRYAHIRNAKGQRGIAPGKVLPAD